MDETEKDFDLLMGWHASVAVVATSHLSIRYGHCQCKSGDFSVSFVTTYFADVFPSPHLWIYTFSHS